MFVILKSIPSCLPPGTAAKALCNKNKKSKSGPNQGPILGSQDYNSSIDDGGFRPIFIHSFIHDGGGFTGVLWFYGLGLLSYRVNQETCGTDNNMPHRGLFRSREFSGSNDDHIYSYELIL